MTGGFWALFRYTLVPALSKGSETSTVPYEEKKYASARTTSYMWPLILLGYNVAVIYAIILFSWKDYFPILAELEDPTPPASDEVFEEIPITEIPPPPPPVVKVPIVEEVEDEEEIPEVEIIFEEEEPDDTPIEPVVDIFDDEGEEEVVEDNNLYNFYDLAQPPSFPGGESAMMKYVMEHYNYPHRDREEGNTGRIFVYFVIQKDGTVGSAEVKRGINERLDAEALRVVKSMPKWKPGMNAGLPVKVSFMLPITLEN